MKICSISAFFFWSIKRLSVLNFDEESNSIRTISIDETSSSSWYTLDGLRLDITTTPRAVLFSVAAVRGSVYSVYSFYSIYFIYSVYSPITIFTFF